MRWSSGERQYSKHWMPGFERTEGRTMALAGRATAVRAVAAAAG